MPPPYPADQRAARDELGKLFSNRAMVRIVHYSCESFDDNPSGKSPRITSIAVRRLDSSDTESFSIHRVAERQGFDIDSIEAHYDELEKIMLDEFFAHLIQSGDVDYLHWNMRDANYGFAAIAHRYQVLGGDPYRIPEHKRHDLSPLLQRIYGSEYIGHPRLETLAKRNKITMLRFMTGSEEAAAFREKGYVALHQSTLRKVDLLFTIADLTYRQQLDTEANWWVVHGGNLRGAWMWLADNKTIALLIALICLVLGGLAIYFIFRPINA